ncbi:MAG: subtilisin [Bacteroidetes bacterium]|nr:MAG: subtilisin [Bacteroidota bacterium]TAG94221.1 MAG: subtilisin [Bacteroidota bacterium]
MYIFVIITMLLSVVWWFYRTHNDQRQFPATLAFFGSCFAYVFTLFVTAHNSIYSYILILPRDIAAVVIVAILANNLKSNKAFFLTACMVGAGVFYGYTYLPTLFFPKKTLDTQGELLVELKNKSQANILQKDLSKWNIVLKPSFNNTTDNDKTTLDEYFTIDVPENVNIEEVFSFLNANANVSNVEYNENYQLNLPHSSNEIKTFSSNYFNDPKISEQWAFEALKLNELSSFLKANNIKPKKRVKIAILDTGVDANHEDLKGNYISTKSSYDKDKQTHGTHCAGIAAAVSNNKIGIASLSPDNAWVQVTSIKVLSDKGWGTQEQIIKGIIEAANGGADVISMSLGGPSDDIRQKIYSEAIRYAQKKGAIVVVAAGNENQSAKNCVPASCEGVIVVSATDHTNNKASFSNTINEVKMGIAAPGENILSTLPNQKYASYSGTSMATPYVAGLLAMMKAINPKITTEKAYSILKASGQDTKNTTQTGKLIYPMKALEMLLK